MKEEQEEEEEEKENAPTNPEEEEKEKQESLEEVKIIGRIRGTHDKREDASDSGFKLRVLKIIRLISQRLLQVWIFCNDFIQANCRSPHPEPKCLHHEAFRGQSKRPKEVFDVQPDESRDRKDVLPPLRQGLEGHETPDQLLRQTPPGRQRNGKSGGDRSVRDETMGRIGNRKWPYSIPVDRLHQQKPR